MRDVRRASVFADADAVSPATPVDCIVFDGDGRTSVRNVEQALRRLPQEKILGLVLNRHKPTKKDATYYPKYYPKK